MTTPTGVFVRLPLSEDQAHAFLKESSHAWDEFNGASDAIACEAGLLAIGTPVTGGELEVVGTIHIGDNGKPFFTAPEIYSTGGDVVRQSDALAKLAKKDAEIARLQDAMKEAREHARKGSWSRAHVVLHKALKGPEA